MESFESNEIVFRSKDKEFIAHDSSFSNARTLTPQPENSSDIPQGLVHAPAKLRHTNESPAEEARRRKARRAVVSSPLVGESKDDVKKFINTAEGIDYRETGLKKLKSGSWESIARWEKENGFLFAIIEDEANWLTRLFPDDPIEADRFFDMLQDGVLLCKLARLCQEYAEELAKKNNKRISPFPIYIHPRSRCRGKIGKFMSRENVELFLQWCRHHKIPEPLLFESNDVVDKTEQDGLRDNAREIVLCLMEVARLGVKFGVEPPTLLLLELEIEREQQQDGSMDGSISPSSVDSGVDTTDIFHYNNNTSDHVASANDKSTENDSTQDHSESYKRKRKIYLDSRQRYKSLDSIVNIRSRTNVRLDARQASFESAPPTTNESNKKEDDESYRETTEFSKYLTDTRLDKDLDEASRFVGVLYPNGRENNEPSSMGTRLIEYEIYNDGKEVDTSPDTSVHCKPCNDSSLHETDSRLRSASDTTLVAKTNTISAQELFSKHGRRSFNSEDGRDTVDSYLHKNEKNDSDTSGGESGLTGRERYRRRKSSVSTRNNNADGGQSVERPKRKSSGQIKSELHQKVTSLLESYNIQKTLRLREGKYVIFGKIMFVRLLNNHCIVRIGGGWDTLEHYLMTHVSKAAPDSFESENTGLPASAVRQGRKKSGNLLRHRKNPFITASTPNLLHINDSPESSTRISPARTRSPSPNRSKDPYEQEKALRRYDDRKISQAILRVHADVVGGVIQRASSLDWTHLKDKEFTLKKYSSITPIAKSKLKLIKKMADTNLESPIRNDYLNDSSNKNDSMNDSANDNIPLVTHEPPTPTVNSSSNPLDDLVKDTSIKTNASKTNDLKKSTNAKKAAADSSKPGKKPIGKMNSAIKPATTTSKTTSSVKPKISSSTKTVPPSKSTTTKITKTTSSVGVKPAVKKAADASKTTGKPVSTSLKTSALKKPTDPKTAVPTKPSSAKASTIKTSSTTSKTIKDPSTSALVKTTKTTTKTTTATKPISAKIPSSAKSTSTKAPTATKSEAKSATTKPASLTKVSSKTVAGKPASTGNKPTSIAKPGSVRSSTSKPLAASKTTAASKPSTKPVANTTLTKATGPASKTKSTTKSSRPGSASPTKKTTSKPTAKVSPTKKVAASKETKSEVNQTDTVEKTEIIDTGNIIIVPTAEVLENQVNEVVRKHDEPMSEITEDENLSAVDNTEDNISQPKVNTALESAVDVPADVSLVNLDETPQEVTEAVTNNEQIDTAEKTTVSEPVAEKTVTDFMDDNSAVCGDKKKNVESQPPVELNRKPVPAAKEDTAVATENATAEMKTQHNDNENLNAHDFDLYCVTPLDRGQYDSDYEHMSSDTFSPIDSPVKTAMPTSLDLIAAEEAIEPQDVACQESTPESDVATCGTERPGSQCLSPNEEAATYDQDDDGRTGRLGFADETALILDVKSQQNMDDVSTEFASDEKVKAVEEKTVQDDESQKQLQTESIIGDTGDTLISDDATKDDGTAVAEPSDIVMAPDSAVEDDGTAVVESSDIFTAQDSETKDDGTAVVEPSDIVTAPDSAVEDDGTAVVEPNDIFTAQNSETKDDGTAVAEPSDIVTAPDSATEDDSTAFAEPSDIVTAPDSATEYNGTAAAEPSKVFAATDSERENDGTAVAEPSDIVADPDSAVEDDGTAVAEPSKVFTAPDSETEDDGTAVAEPSDIVTDPDSAVEDDGTAVAEPSDIVTAPDIAAKDDSTDNDAPSGNIDDNTDVMEEDIVNKNDAFDESEASSAKDENQLADETQTDQNANDETEENNDESLEEGSKDVSDDTKCKEDIDEVVLDSQEIAPVENMPETIENAWSSQVVDSKQTGGQEDEADEGKESDEVLEDMVDEMAEEEEEDDQNSQFFQKKTLLTEESMEVHCGSISFSSNNGRMSTHDFEVEDLTKETLSEEPGEFVEDVKEDGEVFEQQLNESVNINNADGEQIETANQNYVDSIDNELSEEGSITTSDYSTKTEVHTTVVVEHSSTVVCTSSTEGNGKILMGEYDDKEEIGEESEDSEEADSPNHHVMLRQSSANQTVCTTEIIETHEIELLDNNDENESNESNGKTIDNIVDHIDESLLNKLDGELNVGEPSTMPGVIDTDKNQNHCFNDLESY